MVIWEFQNYRNGSDKINYRCKHVERKSTNPCCRFKETRFKHVKV